MAQKTDGGPAFPGTTSQPNGNGIFYPVHHQGMSLRDWFAGQATEEDVAFHRVTKRNALGHPLEPPSSREVAKYRYADAMIAASSDGEG